MKLQAGHSVVCAGSPMELQLECLLECLLVCRSRLRLGKALGWLGVLGPFKPESEGGVEG